MYKAFVSMKLSHRWTLVLLVLLSPLLLLGLRQGRETRAQGPPMANGPAREVRLGYFPNLMHAQALLGVATGEFEQAVAPAKFSSRLFAAGPSLIEALFAGEVDVGYIGPAPALHAHLRSRGRGIRVVAGAAGNGVLIVARPGAGIESLQDLKDRRIATPQLGNSQDISARHFLRTQLGQENARNVLPVPNAELSSLMSRGRIDAAWAVEPWASRLISEVGAVIIAEEKDLWPGGDVGLTVVVATPEFIEREPELLQKLLEVHCAWTERLAAAAGAHVPELASELEQLTGKRLPEELLGTALSRLSFDAEPPIESLETFARWNAELGFARAVANVRTLLDTRALGRARAARAGLPEAEARPQ